MISTITYNCSIGAGIIDMRDGKSWISVDNAVGIFKTESIVRLLGTWFGVPVSSVVDRRIKR